MKLQGKGVSGGIALAPVKVLRKRTFDVPFSGADDIEAEQTRYLAARDAVCSSLCRMRGDAEAQLGRENAELFDTHRLMLEDEDLTDCVLDTIREERSTAAYAVGVAARRFMLMFESMDNEYMRARAQDVRDVLLQVLATLTGGEEQPVLTEPTILAAETFSPGETAQFDRRRVAGILSAKGSENSHAAIFARQLGIPAVMGAGADVLAARDGETAGIDGGTGEAFLSPDEADIAALRVRGERLAAEKAAVQVYRDAPCVTKDGRRVRVYANIADPADVESALANGAEGIGLFRSEFLFLGRTEPPDEETQYAVICRVVQAMQPRPVIIRTMDLGSDKRVPYLPLPKEENPCMGVRGIRASLRFPALLHTQLRAILRASVHGRLAVMFPMIACEQEVTECLAMLNDARQELVREGVVLPPHIDTGIMIETPAAVILSDRLAKLVDFFSIGTNDLSQYTFAADRMNPALSVPPDPDHETILRMIDMTVKNAHEAGIWVGVCGEVGAEVSVAARLVEMGMDELSVNPEAILPLKKEICGMGTGLAAQKNVSVRKER